MRALPDSRRLTETMLKTCLLQVQVCCAMQIEYLIRFYWIQRFLNNGAYKSLYFIDNRLIFVIEWQRGRYQLWQNFAWKFNYHETYSCIWSKTLFPYGNWQPKCLMRHGLSAWIDLSFCIKAKFLARSQIFFQHLGVHSSWKLGLFVLRKVCIRKTPIFYAAIFQCNLIDVKVNTFPIRCFVTEWVPVIKAGWKKILYNKLSKG